MHNYGVEYDCMADCGTGYGELTGCRGFTYTHDNHTGECAFYRGTPSSSGHNDASVTYTYEYGEDTI